MKRKIYDSLLNWKVNGHKPLIVLGARQVGKTYIINEFCQKEFSNYKIINLLNNLKIVDLYKSKQDWYISPVEAKKYKIISKIV